MIVGDALCMFHRSNGQPVRDSNGLPIRVPPDGVPMIAVVSAVINETTVNLTATDEDGKVFIETHVVVLRDDEPLPRGGRYALRTDDTSIHPQPTQHGR